MGKLIKLEIMDMPKLLVMGKAVTQNMQALMEGKNDLPQFWDKCMEEKIMEPLEAQEAALYSGAYVGYMGDFDMTTGNFLYVCGMLMKEGAALPAGYTLREIPACKVGVGWIQGKIPEEVFAPAHELTDAALKAQGYSTESAAWSMEYYDGQRFLVPDAEGNIIMDYYIPVENT